MAHGRSVREIVRPDLRIEVSCAIRRRPFLSPRVHPANFAILFFRTVSLFVTQSDSQAPLLIRRQAIKLVAADDTRSAFALCQPFAEVPRIFPLDVDGRMGGSLFEGWLLPKASGGTHHGLIILH